MRLPAVGLWISTQLLQISPSGGFGFPVSSTVLKATPSRGGARATLRHKSVSDGLERMSQGDGSFAKTSKQHKRVRVEATLEAQHESDQQDALTREPERPGFDWSRQWYPVAVMRDLEALDPRQPFPVKLLGEALVVWKDPKAEEWKCFADRCPHRWAPLSEGRVDQETGRLQCIYHGWEFEGDGKCGSIPQVDSNVRENAQRSRRACARVLPSKIVQGKLWVFPDASAEGLEASKLTAPVTIAEIDDPDFGGEWYARDLQYGFDTLLENLADPAHIPFAHHGVLGDRATGTPMGISVEPQGEDGFKTSNTGYGGARYMTVGFQAPGLVYYRSNLSEVVPSIVKRLPPPLKLLFRMIKTLELDKRLSMKLEDRKDPQDQLVFYFVGYAVPTVPGQCKIFIRNSRNFFLQHPVIPRRWRNSLAAEHTRQHLVLDGDSLALHMQERLLADAGKLGGANAEQTFYMPADADETIRAFRKWYNSRGGSGPKWAEGTDGNNLGPILPRERVLDRWEGHTKYCSACSKAYRVSGKVKRASIGGAVGLLAAAAVVPRGTLALALAGASLMSSGLAVSMARREQKLIFVDYVHATHDG